jgi:hypothetical protein
MFASNLERKHHGAWTEPGPCSQSTLAAFKERRKDVYENHPTAEPHRQPIYVHKYSTGADDHVHDRSSTSDTTYQVRVSDPAAYISAAGQVRVHIRTGDLSKPEWTHYIDFLKITAAP